MLGTPPRVRTLQPAARRTVRLRGEHAKARERRLKGGVGGHGERGQVVKGFDSYKAGPTPCPSPEVTPPEESELHPRGGHKATDVDVGRGSAIGYTPAAP